MLFKDFLAGLRSRFRDYRANDRARVALQIIHEAEEGSLEGAFRATTATPHSRGW